MRIAWLSPLPPWPTGISDYSFEMLPVLAERADVTVVAPHRWPRPLRVPRGIPRLSPRAFDRQADRFDAAIHHLANNPAHEFVYREARRRPGVAVFHDLVLHHLVAFVTFESRRDPAGYRSALQAEYGEVGTRLHHLKVRGAASDFEKFLFPLSAEVAERARAVVVHSEDSRGRMADVAGDVPITVIPHHAGRPPASVAGVGREEARRRVGLPQDAFVVGHFGYVTRPKQPRAVIGGFARLAAARGDALLAVVGADTSGGGLLWLIRRHGVEDRVRVTGYLSLERFYLYLRAVDAVVNLRYPSAGESSGTFARALAEGRATIVNDLGSFSCVPDGAALKVEVDGDQATEVGNHLVRLAEDPAFRSAVEDQALAYARSALDPGRCADLYVAAARGAGQPRKRAPAQPA